MKKAPKFRYLDLAHKSVVVSCIGLTLWGGYMLGNRFYRYFTVVKPNRELDEKRILEVMTNLKLSSSNNRFLVLGT